jgi:hypothetical protein
MTYDAAFFALETQVALSAAQVVVPSILERIDNLPLDLRWPLHVIDVGCGTGAWASVAKSCGCVVTGVDGHAPDDQLMIAPDEFVRQDLTAGVSCAGYDLAMCLEVGEHLPESASDALVAGLCEARYVLWSAAIPGQNGVNHINEQWSSWWEPKFAAHGYVGSCDIRDEHWDDRRIAGFYRQNFVVWSTVDRLAAAGYRQGVRDDVHPDRFLGY